MILVTGANGFVGKALIERLVAEGMPVRAAVRMPATLFSSFVGISHTD